MPSATARDFQRVAKKLGFEKSRQTGSHERWNHADGRAVTIPVHEGFIAKASVSRLRTPAPEPAGRAIPAPFRVRPPRLFFVVVEPRGLYRPGRINNDGEKQSCMRSGKSNLRGSARRIDDYDLLLVLTLDFDNQACRVLQRVVDATRAISRAYWAASRLWDARLVQRHP